MIFWWLIHWDNDSIEFDIIWTVVYLRIEKSPSILLKNNSITEKMFNLPRPRVWAKYEGAIDGARFIVPPKCDGASVPLPPWDPHDTHPSIKNVLGTLKIWSYLSTGQ